MIPYLIDTTPDSDMDLDAALDGEVSEFDRGVLTGAVGVYRNVRPLREKGPRRR